MTNSFVEGDSIPSSAEDNLSISDDSHVTAQKWHDRNFDAARPRILIVDRRERDNNKK
jgi:hypothetical protein